MNNQSDTFSKEKPTIPDFWGTPVLLASTPNTPELRTTENGNALAITLDPGLTLNSQGASPLCDAQMVSFRVPIQVADTQRLTGYFQRLTFGISKSPGARVLISADLAGTMKSWEFGYQLPQDDAVNLPLKSEVIFSVQGLEQSSDLGVGLFGPVADYNATLLITVQRRKEQDFVIVSIDNIDVSAHFAPKQT